MCISSTPHKQTLMLHRKYGDIVRTGPDSVSCLGAQAWQQVCGANNPENPKMPGFFEDAREGIIGADTETHSFQRRIMAPAFSAQGMQRQEPLIRGVGAANVINEHKKLVKDKVDRRLALGSERPDFVEAMKDKLSKQAILDNSTVLIVAGSETTATV
ncbi:putative cytochrome p450 [Diaporthe ampelina]|uniref:Putative cytochrome p450 n=1 Tax=Diaporthe ampelina TaxID=1214573 RepID=A0A0G2FFC1_9PEZI|nr:putative cytochrome p450 [Diaporthe ampelina]